jgi:murein DD-endopeptidase MepM/ murein hydrolase activator NlpD
MFEEAQMSKLKFVGAAALVAAMACLRANAAAPVLPPGAIDADTVVVAHADAASFTPESVRKAATAILGPNAAQGNQGLAKFEEKYNAVLKAGGQSLTMVSEDKSKAAGAADGAAAPSGQGIMYIQLKPGADVDAIEKTILEDMRAEEREKAVFEKKGDFLVMHQKGEIPPILPDAGRAKVFSDALSSVSDAAIQIAFVPNQAARDKAKQQAGGAPKQVQDAMPILTNSKWVTIAVKLGNAPAATATANTADVASAQKLTDDINGFLAYMKQTAANPNAGGQAGPGPEAMIAMMVAPLADSLKPTTNGTNVSITITGQAVSGIAQMFMHAAGPGGPPRGQ